MILVFDGVQTISVAESAPSGSPLTAPEIYGSKFKSEPLRGIPASNLQWPTSLKFSRFPGRVALALTDGPFKTEHVTTRISILDQRGAEHLVGQIPDVRYKILDGTWIPLLDEDAAAVESLRGLAPPGDTPIGLHDFIKLTSSPLAKKYLVDRTRTPRHTLSRLLADLPRRDPQGLAEGTALYPYQQEGWRWLRLLKDMRLGALLADEMGLGKTLQVIALLADCNRPQQDTPNLVVVPSSLLENWTRELRRFAPSIRMLAHRGNMRASNYRDLLKADLVITTYDLVWSDLSMLEQVDWSILVLDEAHLIRNPETKRFRGISRLSRKFAVAVTGTPIQNSLRDAWALFDFVLPGYCGPVEQFVDEYADTIEHAIHLEPKLTPFMLRRTVDAVAKDLPALINIPQVLELSESEAHTYDEIRRELIATGKGSLAAIMPLRQLCCHPVLYDATWENVDLLQSSKFRRLAEILQEIRAANEKVLVFTSFNQMADIISRYAAELLKMPTEIINGQIPISDRQNTIDRFCAVNGSAVMVLNPNAAGIGLNIQCANHVVHYNLEWNPAVEDQATARAYRRGQMRPVTVHRLYYAGTIEEVMDSRVSLKRGMANEVVKGVRGTDSDIALALSLSPRLSDGN